MPVQKYERVIPEVIIKTVGGKTTMVMGCLTPNTPHLFLKINDIELKLSRVQLLVAAGSPDDGLVKVYAYSTDPQTGCLYQYPDIATMNKDFMADKTSGIIQAKSEEEVTMYKNALAIAKGTGKTALVGQSSFMFHTLTQASRYRSFTNNNILTWKCLMFRPHQIKLPQD